MAPSSLKKMSVVQEKKEGNYASSKTIPWGTFTNSDLGLTLLPGSQIQRKDEKRSAAAAKSGTKNLGSKCLGELENRVSFETELQEKNPSQETAFLDEAKSLSSSLNPGSGSAKVSHQIFRTNRERHFYQIFNGKNGHGLSQHDADTASAAATPYDEQKMGTGELRDANSCQRDDDSPRALKWRKLESRTSNEVRDVKVSRGNAALSETHHNRFHVYHDQDQFQINKIHLENEKESFSAIGIPFSGGGGGLGPSKPVSHRQTTHSPDIAPALYRQRTSLGCEDGASNGKVSALVASTSSLPGRHQTSQAEKLKVHTQLPNLPKTSTPRSKDSRLLTVSSPKFRAQVLKPKKDVKNRSWTSHFPANAKLPRRANLLVAPLTPSEVHQCQHLISASLTSTNLHASANFPSTSPSPSLPKHPIASKALNDSLVICALQSTLDTAHAGSQRQSNRRRSTSMPNLWSPRANMDINPSNNFRPDGSCNRRQRLDVKSTYTRGEVKSLMWNVVQQAQTLRAETTSVNTAMKKGIETLQHEKAVMIQQIQRYERTIAQKDQQIQALHQKGFSQQQQYRRLLDEHNGFIAALRKENGTGNPSAIAHKIRCSHASNPVDAASHSSQQSGYAARNHNKANSPQPVSISAYPESTVAAASGFGKRTMGQATEPVTIDLTDDSQPPSSLASRDISVHHMRQSSVQGGFSPIDILPGQYSPPQYLVGHSLSQQSQVTPNQDSQGTDLEAMQIQGKAFARMAEKPLSWLQGENPFKKGSKTKLQTELPGSRQPSQSSAEGHNVSADSLEAGSVAPLPQTATGRNTKTKAPKKTKVVLTAEAKKERAKRYRRTAAEKKRREIEVATPRLQDEIISNNAIRAQKEDRRANKEGKRREQGRQPLGEVRPWEPQKLLDGQLYQDTGIQEAMHRGSIEQPASDDQDSLFGDDVDSQMEIEEPEASPEADMRDDEAAVEEDVDTATYVAEVEALFAADEDAGAGTGVEQIDVLGGDPGLALPPGGDDGYHDFSSSSEESEEE